MACRVGMSTDPMERVKYWKAKEGYTNHDVLARGLSYDQALAREAKEAQTRGCKYEGGGPRKPGYVWSVYIVW